MKINIFKKIVIIFFSVLILFILLLLFDLAKYDSSYVNRKSLTFNLNNLNSKKSEKFFYHIYNNWHREIAIKIFKNHEEYWKVEEPSIRANLPKFKVIPGKKENFLPGRKIEEMEINLSNWPRSHGGFSSMRFSNLDLINKNNIDKLELAWKYNSEDGKKGIQANLVVYKGLIYLPTPGNNIVCLDAANGKVLWKYKVERGYHAAKRGFLIWNDKKNDVTKLFFTNDDQLISLNAKTGKPTKNFGKNGIIKIGSSPIPPVIIDNQLVIATFRPSIEVYNIESGKLYWKYYLREIDKKIFGAKDFKGGNPWGGISADTKNGIVYLTTGNPGFPIHIGTMRPGKNLLANSVIAFDVRNKKKLWHFQETCHDIWNLDIAAPPILTTINKYNKRIDVVIAVTKLGNTLILDRYSGEPIFDYQMKLAPRSLIPGEKTCKYQPLLKLPEPFARNVFKKEDVTNLSKSSKEYILSIIENSNYGFFEPYEPNKTTIHYNMGGGAQWTGASVDPFKNVMYVTANDIPSQVTIKKIGVNEYVDVIGDFGNSQLRDLNGYPGVKPPWGTLTAINLNTGKIIWQVPLGYYKNLKSKGIITGTENYGGATATAGGLVFVAGTIDKLIRAFDSETGAELWSHELPYIGSAPPTSYEINGEQYIAIPATGGITLGIDLGDLVKQGDAFVAFKIKD